MAKRKKHKKKSRSARRKPGRTRSRGPKYGRYFGGYSDHMIVQGLADATMIILGSLNEAHHHSETIEPEGIIVINLPDIDHDPEGKYGVLAIPGDHVNYFLRNKPYHESRRIGKRQAPPPWDTLTYLTEPNLTHPSCREIAEFIIPLWGNTQLIPFRQPVSEGGLSSILERSGYPYLFSLKYGWPKDQSPRSHIDPIAQSRGISPVYEPDGSSREEYSIHFHNIRSPHTGSDIIELEEKDYRVLRLTTYKPPKLLQE